MGPMEPLGGMHPLDAWVAFPALVVARSLAWTLEKVGYSVPRQPPQDRSSMEPLSSSHHPSRGFEAAKRVTTPRNRAFLSRLSQRTTTSAGALAVDLI